MRRAKLSDTEDTKQTVDNTRDLGKFCLIRGLWKVFIDHLKRRMSMWSGIGRLSSCIFPLTRVTTRNNLPSMWEPRVAILTVYSPRIDLSCDCHACTSDLRLTLWPTDARNYPYTGILLVRWRTQLGQEPV